MEFDPIWDSLLYFLGFPCSSAGKESSCDAGDPGSIPGSGRSTGEGIGYLYQYSWASLVCNAGDLGLISGLERSLPTPVFWPGEFHGLYSPWGSKESDMTE